MIILGLTGSIGMGKTTTANMFAQQGIPVHDADKAVHELYAGKAVAIIETEFPNSTKNGKIDRSKLSKQILGKPKRLKKLETIIHPMVAEHRNQFIKTCKENNADLIVLDIPLLFETNSDELCDYILVVTTSKEQQTKRVLSRNGMTKEKFEKILSLQMPDEEKRKRADFIIDTSKGIEDANQQVIKIIADIKEKAKNA